MACDSATDSVKSRGGPFGAVLVQIDDKTGEVLRYWSTGNKVTLLKDPTAHAEILAIRSACKSLGTFKLSDINKRESKLPQKGNTSHCEIYSSCEPCPMCYSAIYWARIAVLYFAATRFDASSPGIDFSDKAIYEDLTKPYRDRKLIVKKCNSQNYNEAFILWQKTGHIEY
ncbi:MAG: nucleoside deaminase [Bacteroidales bacterium]|nr:nucleoside deaminase [Bacteroidales bacterium]MBN2817986.1 nucleoside deaminase [Bacteroidales bacterium]